MKIVADIGGTHARFAVYENGAFSDFKKYRAADFTSLEAALESYSAKKMPLLIATAAYEDGDVWRFINNNQWVIDPKALQKSGWTVEIILNDFAAATWGLMALPERKILKAGKSGYEDFPRCLLGPGTGLGLGYLNGAGVQRTHGGHIVASAVTEEQEEIIRGVRGFQGKVVVFENLVSGPGLYNIYRAQCQIEDKPCALKNAEELFAHLDEAQEPLRLFHEFLGLFAATAVVCGHAYGGLSLTGGVLERLMAAQRFNFKQFEKFFVPELAVSVKRDLGATEISFITEEFLAFRGLLKAAA